MNYNKLSDDEKRVIESKATERPFSGKYNDFNEDGVYICKKCDTPLFCATSKFSSGCGWPSFDDDLGTVKKLKDADGKRVEIVCANCNGHLGHIFEGEGFTSKNTRHCVNSISLKFEHKDLSKRNDVVYFAAGCFWGVEYYFKKQKGVKQITCGYMGGETDNPTYEDICKGTSGHLEVIKVQYDSCEVAFEKLAKLFFEIHDFTQTNGQGPDIGSQYLSGIFFTNEEQKLASMHLIDELTEKKYEIATTLYEERYFYEAESYHQNYYEKNQKTPYCHNYKKIF